MKINDAEFLTSVYEPGQYPSHDFSEFTFVGRSNVGKSSLINMILKRKKLAKTSSSPGRTQSINFYKINRQFYFADLPGYGFAKVPPEVKENWQELINDYLHYRENLKGIIMIIDARHKPTADDITMLEWIESMQIPRLLVATKVDKLSSNQRNKQKDKIMKTLNLKSENEFEFVSAKTGEGRNKIHGFILEHIQ
ncbi:MAG: ribosome biogenesis GTP-binding protein YihA/YsxC [Halanaerobiales bacterium]